MEAIFLNISTSGCPVQAVRVVAQTDKRSEKVLKAFGHILRPECAGCLGIDQAPLSIVGGSDPGGFRPFDPRTGKICE